MANNGIKDEHRQMNDKIMFIILDFFDCSFLKYDKIYYSKTLIDNDSQNFGYNRQFFLGIVFVSLISN